MAKMEGRLEVNSLIRHDGRVWLVGMVNDSRARIHPISGLSSASPVSGKSFTTFGSAIDIAPNAYVPLVDEAELSDIERVRFNRIKQEGQMAVAAPPVSGKSLKEQNAERRAKLAESKAAKAAEPKAAKVKEPKAQNPCKCGGAAVTGGHFFPGHDARFKGWLLAVERGQKKVEELPEAVRTAYKWKKTPDGKGFMPTLNYKGEPHAGYGQA